jgi:hypothetical protein
MKEKIFSLEPKNKTCNDCGDGNATYASINNGITLCDLCAQIHKNFGNQISFIKSLDEPLDDYLIRFYIYGGNKKFRRTLRKMGVNLDMKKGHLYRTFGADFYRRNLKAIVKGDSHLDIDFKENPNDIMKNDSNSFPEFNTYQINSFGLNNKNDIFGQDNKINIIENELNDLNLGIDLNMKNDYKYENEMNEDLSNNKDIEINEEKKIESVENKPENVEGDGQAPPPPEVLQNKKDKDDDEDSLDRRVKKVMQLSVQGVKTLGGFMKKSGISGFELAKKYGKIAFQNASNYVKEQVYNLNKK